MTPQQHIIQSLQALSPLKLEVQDESHLHIGHREAKNGAHFKLSIVSERFVGMSALARHRLVYQSIGDLSGAGIHALNISAHAPGSALLTTKETL